MSTAKAEILERIRGALSDQPVPDPVQRTYRRESEKTTDEVIEQLKDRLIDYKANVYEETASTVAGRIEELLGADASYVVPSGLDEAWLPSAPGLTRITEPPVGAESGVAADGGTENASHAGNENKPQAETENVSHGHDEGADGRRPLTVAELDALDSVVTSSTVSCSETGTIFLSGRPDEGRRAITLVPDHHVCIVPRSSVVELIPESLERLEPTATITMISGPSATSDIELERVEGVHGPRTLDVIILDA